LIPIPFLYVRGSNEHCTRVPVIYQHAVTYHAPAYLVCSTPTSRSLSASRFRYGSSVKFRSYRIARSFNNNLVVLPANPFHLLRRTLYYHYYYYYYCYYYSYVGIIHRGFNVAYTRCCHHLYSTTLASEF
jgi:hypothetical protein